MPCPFELLRQYSKARPPFMNDSDQLFVLSDRSLVTATMVRNCFKNALLKENFSVNLYTLHGIHSGRAGDLFKLCFSRIHQEAQSLEVQCRV